VLVFWFLIAVQRMIKAPWEYCPGRFALFLPYLFVLPTVPHDIGATLRRVLIIKVHGPLGHDGSVYRLHRN